jgi:hypothetical protein
MLRDGGNTFTFLDIVQFRFRRRTSSSVNFPSGWFVAARARCVPLPPNCSSILTIHSTSSFFLTFSQAAEGDIYALSAASATLLEDAELDSALEALCPLPPVTCPSVADVSPTPQPRRPLSVAQLAVLAAARARKAEVELGRSLKRGATAAAAAKRRTSVAAAEAGAADSAGSREDAETPVDLASSPQLLTLPPPIQRRWHARAASISARHACAGSASAAPAPAGSASAAPAPAAPASAAPAPAAPPPGGALGTERDAPSNVHPCVVCGKLMRRGKYLLDHCFEVHRDALLPTVPVRDESGTFPAFLAEGNFACLADAEAQVAHMSTRLGTSLRPTSMEASATARVRVLSCDGAEKPSVVAHAALHRCVSELLLPTETGRDSDAAHKRKMAAGLLRGRIGSKTLDMSALACFFTVVLTSTRPVSTSAATPDGSSVEEDEDDRTWPVHMQVLGGHTHLPPTHAPRRGGKTHARRTRPRYRMRVRVCATHTSSSPLSTFRLHYRRTVRIMYNTSSTVNTRCRLSMYLST